MPGNSPPNSDVASQVPMTGMDSMIAVGDAQARAGQRVVGQRVAGEALDEAEPEQHRPMIQLSSRGLRNAPVKKIRSMCTTIAAMNSSAAQWCIWRMIRPPRTSNEMFSDVAYACDMACPRSGT